MQSQAVVKPSSSSKRSVNTREDSTTVLSTLSTEHANDPGTRLLAIIATKISAHSCFRDYKAQNAVFQEVQKKPMHPFLAFVCKIGLDDGDMRMDQLVHAHAFCKLDTVPYNKIPDTDEEGKKEILAVAVRYICMRAGGGWSAHANTIETREVWPKLWAAYFHNHRALCVALEIAKTNDKLPFDVFLNLFMS